MCVKYKTLERRLERVVLGGEVKKGRECTKGHIGHEEGKDLGGMGCKEDTGTTGVREMGWSQGLGER